MYSRIYHRLHF